MSESDHGTYGGYQRHKRRRETACIECTEANRQYQAGVRASKPETIRRATRQAKVRNRALARLQEAHPAEYERLLTDEWTKEATR